jgi:hypothetical protein
VVNTDKTGNFVFVAVQPGTYSVSVVASGFKSFDKKGLQLSSAERLSAGVLKLEVGATSEAVSVTAEATPIQAESSERSALLEAKEVSSLMSIGRDPLALTRTMPGVVMDGDGASSLGQSGIGSIAGQRSVNNTMSVDGVTGNTRGGANMDSNLDPDIKDNINQKSKGIVEHFYGWLRSDIDKTKFKEGLDAASVSEIIICFVQGFSNNELEKLRYNPEYQRSFDPIQVMTVFDHYIETLTGVFYK